MTEVIPYLTLWHYAWFCVGGGFGAAMRFSLTQSTRHLSQRWPAGTLLVNAIGALVLGAISAYWNHAAYSPGFLFWELGVLGSFTTFSTYSVEVIAMLRARRFGAAIIYAFSSVVIVLASLVLGFHLAGLLL
ncbi:fluoride efflux transporter CrcB [Aliidiomarina sp. Khilg15.8]